MEVGTKVRLIGERLMYIDPKAEELMFIDTGEVGVVAEMTPRLEELRIYDDEFVVQYGDFIGTEDGFYFRECEQGIEWEVVDGE